MDCPACHSPNIDAARFCAKCGALMPEAPPASAEVDPVVGTVIGGRFHIVGILGEGGMGRVYSAEQQMGTSVRRAAVKMLLAQYAKDPQVVARFMRECGTVSELEHPNTIKVYDFGQTADGDLYIAMELLAGASLEKTLEQGPLPADRVERILAQVCGSLQEAHDKGIVHRDLKPANIYLTKRGGRDAGADYVKVLDFGIAKRDDKGGKEAKLTQQGTVLGTPPYMSPEQFRGQELDPRSDIYSLGVMTYEMLTGRLPFDADTPWAWATQHMTAQPFPFETVPLGSAVPNNMKAAVMRALSKDRDHRPQSVTEFYTDFAHDGAQALAAASMLAASAGSAVFLSPALAAQGAHTGASPSTHPPSSVPGGVAAAAQMTGAATYASSPAMEIPAGAYADGPQVPPPPPPVARRAGGWVIGIVAAVALAGTIGAMMVVRTRSSSGDDKGDTTAHGAQPSATPPPPAQPEPPKQLQPDDPPEPVPTQPKTLPDSHPGDQACHRAEAAAARDNIPEARRHFVNCDGPEKATARAAIDAAEKRLHGQPCRGRHCPKFTAP